MPRIASSRSGVRGRDYLQTNPDTLAPLTAVSCAFFRLAAAKLLAAIYLLSRNELRPVRCSSDDVFDDLTMNISQSEVPSRVAISKVLVVQAQQVEKRRMEIMEVYFVF